MNRRDFFVRLLQVSSGIAMLDLTKLATSELVETIRFETDELIVRHGVASWGNAVPSEHRRLLEIWAERWMEKSKIGREKFYITFQSYDDNDFDSSMKTCVSVKAKVPIEVRVPASGSDFWKPFIDILEEEIWGTKQS